MEDRSRALVVGCSAPEVAHRWGDVLRTRFAFPQVLLLCSLDDSIENETFRTSLFFEGSRAGLRNSSFLSVEALNAFFTGNYLS